MIRFVHPTGVKIEFVHPTGNGRILIWRQTMPRNRIFMRFLGWSGGGGIRTLEGPNGP
jgi:hypothetical protein